MTTINTVKIVKCDGCNNVIGSEHEAAKSHPTDDIHICMDCFFDEKYYCRLCGKVHDDLSPCKEMLARTDAAGIDAGMMDFEQWKDHWGNKIQ